MAIIPSAFGGQHQHIYGIVDPMGNPVSGEGFKSRRLSTGAYLISFDAPFSRLPAAVCTIYGPPEWTFDKSIAIIEITERAFVCFTSSPNNVVDSAFTFIAFGDLT